MKTDTELRTGRSLISDDLWERMVFNHTRVHHVTREYAERVLDQGVAFLDMVASTGQKLSPSPIVDEGWHTFILHTIDYDAFTQAHYDRFVGHIPFGPTEVPDPEMIPTTLGQLEKHGYYIDYELWTGSPDCRNTFKMNSSTCRDHQAADDNTFQPSWVAPCNHTCDNAGETLQVSPCTCHSVEAVLDAIR